MKYTETIVMSVGGSLIVPGEIDTLFLENLYNFINQQVTERKRFIIIAGGGKTARKYQDAVSAVIELAQENLDWMGIHATRLNAQLLRTIFTDNAHPEVVTNPDDIGSVPEDYPVVIASGYKPGASTDLRAVQIAINCGAEKVINLSDIDCVYSDDPQKNSEAEKIENITWKDFIKLIPSEWKPGLSSPFDPIAAREAEKNDMEVAIINGNKLSEIEKYLAGEKFIGTQIHP